MQEKEEKRRLFIDNYSHGKFQLPWLQLSGCQLILKLFKLFKLHIAGSYLLCMHRIWILVKWRNECILFWF